MNIVLTFPIPDGPEKEDFYTITIIARIDEAGKIHLPPELTEQQRDALTRHILQMQKEEDKTQGNKLVYTESVDPTLIDVIHSFKSTTQLKRERIAKYIEDQHRSINELCEVVWVEPNNDEETTFSVTVLEGRYKPYIRTEYLVAIKESENDIEIFRACCFLESNLDYLMAKTE